VIVVDGGSRVLAKGYGFADRAASRKNTAGTIFRIGSMSKQFAATAVLVLVNERKIALTDRVSKFFPSYPVANLSRDGVEVTIHHLLSHTSGLPDPRNTPAFRDAVWKRPIAPREQVALASSLPLVRVPGSAFEYLNFNYLLAALIVEQVSGRPYDSFLKERFFVPLGMSDSGTVLRGTEAAHAAVGYAEPPSFLSLKGGDGRSSSEDPDFTFAFGSGQVYSTGPDLARWDRALAGESVLPAAARDLLFRPNLKNNGYGWVVGTKNGVAFAWHNGALSPAGFTSYMLRVPSLGRFVAFLANRDVDQIEPFETKVEALAVP
jgi:CubicO group peptidase (beta-lactamase class C family)